MIRWLGRMLLSLLQMGSVVAAYQLIAVALVAILPNAWPQYFPAYDSYNAVGDTQMILIVLLVWDRFYGPSAWVMRGVGKALGQAQARRKARDYEL